MPKFTVTITETITTKVVVNTDNPNQTIDLALAKYNNGAKDTGVISRDFDIETAPIDFSAELDGISLTCFNDYHIHDWGFGDAWVRKGDTLTYDHNGSRGKQVRLVANKTGNIVTIEQHKVGRYFILTPVELA